ncbi:spore coat protein [Bacillus paralicheniformis]|uniref:spore coat protein n=1 Tax=Bacillus paralicheniformis TaxID=1648923 RepID=UPI001FD6F528|nr:spore coat protein [Bacillus paralicheniformis]MCJ8223002.1 spore coat protein [Bacillus paralicheniformis]MDW6054490.1 spore coat protein [Bacillus paralicheniformis]
MADFEKLQENVDPIMKSVVKNILKNRGVTSDKVRKLSEEEKENIFNMLEDLKKQSDALVQRQKEIAAAKEKGAKREKIADASSENGERTRRRRNRTNRLRDKLRQRREQENTATAENSTESDTSAANEEKNGDL